MSTGHGLPQWLLLGREAAGRALYEAWHPLRMDNDCPTGSFAWEDLDEDVRERYIAAGEAACRAYHDSTLASSRLAIAALSEARLSAADTASGGTP